LLHQRLVVEVSQFTTVCNTRASSTDTSTFQA